MRLTQEQKKLIETTYHKYFKNSAIKYWEYDDGGYMWVRFYLAENEKELFNTYWDNDVFKIDFEIDTCFEGYCLKARTNMYVIKPTKDYYWCDYRKIPFRQVKGSFDKIMNGLERFFQRLHKQFKEDLDNKIIKDDLSISMFDNTNVSHNYIGAKHLVR